VCNALRILWCNWTSNALAKVTGSIDRGRSSELPTQGCADAEIVLVGSNWWLTVEVLIKVETPVQIAYYFYAQIRS